MRKFSPMFVMAVWMVLALFACALLMDGMYVLDRIVLLGLAVVVSCVYMLCQSRVERANAPLILRDESVYEKTKPPECIKE